MRTTVKLKNNNENNNNKNKNKLEELRKDDKRISIDEENKPKELKKKVWDFLCKLIYNVIVSILGRLITWIIIVIVPLIVYYLVNKPIFISLSLIPVILIIPAVVVTIIYKFFVKKLEDIPPQKPNSKRLLILPFIATLVFICLYIVTQTLVPVFEITSPENNAVVDQTIGVEGHGAIPGNEITVFVIDDLGQKWQGSNTTSTSNGDWEIYPVYIGDSSNIQKGKNFSIYAEINYKDKEISTKIVHVIGK